MILTKQSAMHIIDAANNILLRKEDMQGMHILLERSSDIQVLTTYKSYICEIIRQCSYRK